MQSRTAYETPQLLNLLQNIQTVSFDDFADMLDRKNNNQTLISQSILSLVDTVKEYIDLRNKNKIETDQLIALVINELEKANIDKNFFNHDLLVKLSIFIDLCPLGSMKSFAFTTLCAACGTYYTEKILDKNSHVIKLDKENFKHYETLIRKKINSKVNQKEELIQQCELYLKHLEKQIKKAGQTNPNEYILSTNTHFNKKHRKLKIFLEKDFNMQSFISDNGINPKSISEVTRKAIEKCQIITKLQIILEDENLSLKEKLFKFEKEFTENRPLIEKRRDTASMTFLKVAGSVMSFGLGIPLLWKIEGRSFAKNVSLLFTPAPIHKKQQDYVPSFLRKMM